MAEYFFPLSRREEIAEDTLAFTFDTRGSGFSFRAGQHVDLTLIDPPATDAEGNNRTFSIASSPNETASILIATRMRPTAFKNIFSGTFRSTAVGPPFLPGAFMSAP